MTDTLEPSMGLGFNKYEHMNEYVAVLSLSVNSPCMLHERELHNIYQTVRLLLRKLEYL